MCGSTLSPLLLLETKATCLEQFNSGPLELREEGFEEDRMDISTPPANEIL